MANLDLSKYGIKDVKEILHNPSYDVLFAEETKPGLEGFEMLLVTTVYGCRGSFEPGPYIFAQFFCNRTRIPEFLM